MAMTRARKEQEVASYKERFENSETVVVVLNNGLTVAEITELRKGLRAEGASLKTTKNTLAKMALKGTQFEGLTDMFAGPVSVATSADPVAAAKIVHNFAKDHKKIEIVGGAMGASILDKDGVEQLAKMPSLDELRGKLVGLLQAPATKVAGVLQAPAGQLARLAGAYGAKGE